MIGLRQGDPNREKGSRQKPSRSQNTPLHFLSPRVAPLQWLHFGGVWREYSLTAEAASAGEAHTAPVRGGEAVPKSQAERRRLAVSYSSSTVLNCDVTRAQV